MHHWLRHIAMATLSAVLTMLLGCASTQPSRLYVLTNLSSLDSRSQLAPAGQGPVIGVGPVTFPKYLDRPQIASRYELTFAEFERWAEPLNTNFTRAFTEHLARLIPTDRLVVFPWPRATPIDYQVTVEVAHFFGQIGETSEG